MNTATTNPTPAPQPMITPASLAGSLRKFAAAETEKAGYDDAITLLYSMHASEATKAAAALESGKATPPEAIAMLGGTTIRAYAAFRGVKAP